VLTTEQRIKKLVENHTKYFNSIMVSFGNQLHELLKELENEKKVE
jgi:flavorubredoxin